jgi:threonine dehydratase
MPPIAVPSLADIESARVRIKGLINKTPMLRLQRDGRQDIYLKLELLQPVGSFKIRCAANAIMCMPREIRERGVITASAGNFAQGLGYAGRELGVRVTAVVPQTAAVSKVQALKRLGVVIDPRPYAEWWSVLEDPVAHGFRENFIHPCLDPAVIAGNGTIGLEILDELDPAVVLVPYGGGGLITGIATAIKSLRPNVRMVAAESAAGTPVAAAIAAGRPTAVPFDSGTFITGMGSPRVLEPIWKVLQPLLDGAVCVSLSSVAAAIRTLVDRHHIVAEGAGAVPVAAALADDSLQGPVVCIVSGGHLDPLHLTTILNGDVP